MKVLKREEVDRHSFRDLVEPTAATSTFIDRAYNLQRLQSALGYLALVEFQAITSRPWAAAQQP